MAFSSLLAFSFCLLPGPLPSFFRCSHFFHFLLLAYWLFIRFSCYNSLFNISSFKIVCIIQFKLSSFNLFVAESIFSCTLSNRSWMVKMSLMSSMSELLELIAWPAIGLSEANFLWLSQQVSYVSDFNHIWSMEGYTCLHQIWDIPSIAPTVYFAIPSSFPFSKKPWSDHAGQHMTRASCTSKPGSFGHKRCFSTWKSTRNLQKLGFHGPNKLHQVDFHPIYGYPLVMTNIAMENHHF